MNIKKRFAIIFSTLFSALLGTVLLFVYYSFLNFRRAEFRTRLAQRGETTIKFLMGVEGINRHLLEIFDKNRVNRLFNEKTTIFNDRMERIYTSNASYNFNVTPAEFRKITGTNSIVKRRGDFDVIGRYFVYGDRKYYVLVSAEDVYETTKMRFLKYLLIGSFVVGTVAVWFLSFFLSRASLRPLDRMRNQLLHITEKNLDQRLPLSTRNDEINALSGSFNVMIDKIDRAYHRQKEFTSHASHEMRTPIARITAQLQNLSEEVRLDDAIKESLNSVSDELYRLSELISSLLLLSELDHYEETKNLRRTRLDELIFEAAEFFAKVHPDLNLEFKLATPSLTPDRLEIWGDNFLLSIVFANLLKNAYHYSDDRRVECTISAGESDIRVTFSNTGLSPNASDTSLLFNTFARGSNASGKSGSGIGLSIVKRILDLHNATITYQVPQPGRNVIIINFASWPFTHSRKSS